MGETASVIDEEERSMSGPLEFFAVANDESTLSVLKRVQGLGLGVVVKGCPPSAADWVAFPFVREPSGQSYYGDDSIEVFLQRVAARKPRVGNR